MVVERKHRPLVPIFTPPIPTSSHNPDCLYLNVYVPRSTPPPGGFPVMFWIYGGGAKLCVSRWPTFLICFPLASQIIHLAQMDHTGYVIGDGYEFGFYRGKYLAATRDVIVVEHNYRLGVLGLLSLPVRARFQPSDFFHLCFAQRTTHLC